MQKNSLTGYLPRVTLFPLLFSPLISSFYLTFPSSLFIFRHPDILLLLPTFLGASSTFFLTPPFLPYLGQPMSIDFDMMPPRAPRRSAIVPTSASLLNRIQKPPLVERLSRDDSTIKAPSGPYVHSFFSAPFDFRFDFLF